jgi:protein phosphatase PTC7
MKTFALSTGRPPLAPARRGGGGRGCWPHAPAAPPHPRAAAPLPLVFTPRQRRAIASLASEEAATAASAAEQQQQPAVPPAAPREGEAPGGASGGGKVNGAAAALSGGRMEAEPPAAAAPAAQQQPAPSSSGGGAASMDVSAAANNGAGAAAEGDEATGPAPRASSDDGDSGSVVSASSTLSSSSSSSGGGDGGDDAGRSDASSSGAAAAAGTATKVAEADALPTSTSSGVPGASADAADAAGAAAKAHGPAAPPAVVMLSGASMLPHPEKAHRGGEDAFFISDPPLAIGVADGVGGWAEIGVDAGAYARLLMLHAKEEAEALLSSGGALSPQAVLERAYYRTNVQGSSTVCILALNGTTLCASNLGDSGFVIVRDGAPAFQSPQQQHNFNFPYQLGSADGGASDHPQSAMRFELTVQPGDIIISGSDGLWDNVFAEEAATIVSRCRAQGDGPDLAAHTLCRCGPPRALRRGRRWAAALRGRRLPTAPQPAVARQALTPPPAPHSHPLRYARMRATDPKYHSPFSYAAIQAGYVFLGGKLDDITVLVSYVAHPESKL